jgi:hypothetical protein
MHTYGTALALADVTIPGHLDAQAEVPVLTGPQAQGDLLVIPVDRLPVGVTAEAVPDSGVQVVVGEATGHTHWLHRGFDSPGVGWARVDRDLIIGYVVVPEGKSAMLIHTDEHGANGIGSGVYAVHGKREMAAEIRRVAD